MKEPDPQELKLEQAKLLYMQYRPVAEIARTMGLVPATIYHHVSSKGWKEERSKQLDHLVKDIAETSKEQLAKLWAVGLPLIVNSVLKTAKKNQDCLSIKEAKELSDIMINFQKLQSVNIEDAEGRLASNKTKHLTLSEIKEIFLSDKFLDIEMREVNGHSTEPTRIIGGDLNIPDTSKPRTPSIETESISELINRDSGNTRTTADSESKPDASLSGDGAKDPFTS